MMLDKRLAATGAAVAIVAAAAVTAALFPGREEAAPIQEPVSDVEILPLEEEPPSQESQEEEYLFLLKEHEGRIALFPKDSTEPEMVFEKQMKHLPEYDRILLEKGIPIASEEELVARIEDYIS